MASFQSYAITIHVKVCVEYVELSCMNSPQNTLYCSKRWELLDLHNLKQMCLSMITIVCVLTLNVSSVHWCLSDSPF